MVTGYIESSPLENSPSASGGHRRYDGNTPDPLTRRGIQVCAKKTHFSFR